MTLSWLNKAAVSLFYCIFKAKYFPESFLLFFSSFFLGGHPLFLCLKKHLIQWVFKYQMKLWSQDLLPGISGAQWFLQVKQWWGKVIMNSERVWFLMWQIMGSVSHQSYQGPTPNYSDLGLLVDDILLTLFTLWCFIVCFC